MQKCNTHLATCPCLAGRKTGPPKSTTLLSLLGEPRASVPPHSLPPLLGFSKAPVAGLGAVHLCTSSTRWCSQKAASHPPCILWSLGLAGHGEQARGLALRIRPRATCPRRHLHPGRLGFGGHQPPPSGSVRLLLTMRQKASWSGYLLMKLWPSPGLGGGGHSDQGAALPRANLWALRSFRVTSSCPFITQPTDPHPCSVFLF